MALYKIVIDHR